MSLLDLITGGKSSAAEDAYKHAQDVLAGVQTPTAAQLTLPELQKEVIAGRMTPQEAQAALIKSNEFNNVKTDPRALEAEMTALNKLQDVSDAGGMTDEMKAQMTDALNQVKTQEQGQNASILDQFAQRGVPTSLLSGAMQSANAGQGAEEANKAATDAAGQAEINALNAAQSAGTMAGQMHGQQYSEEANKASAANAINQWNAANTTNVNEANTQRKQAADAANVQNAQDVSNTNTGLANERTRYNANVPQQVFNNNLAKATGQAGASQNLGNLEQNQGKQNAGIISGGINAVTQLLGPTGVAAGKVAGGAAGGAAGGPIPLQTQQYYAEGGKVPGTPAVHGDSPRNDTVPARLSPGEVVVPRSIAPHPEMVKNFVTNLMRNRQPVKPVHPDDVRSLLEALHNRREGTI